MAPTVLIQKDGEYSMVFLLFPTNLYLDVSPLYGKEVLLLEEPTFFTGFRFHKMKLMLHRATMKYYHHFLTQKNIRVSYVEYHRIRTGFYRSFSEVTMYEPNNMELLKTIRSECRHVSLLHDPTFSLDRGYIPEKPTFREFYKHHRRLYRVLMKTKDKPMKDKWSFDRENQKSLPRNHSLPPTYKSNPSHYVKEARVYVERHFADHYGQTDHFVMPVSHSEASVWLDNFVNTRLKNFGKYQDAIHSDDPFLYHSVISPLLNIGLLTDRDVIRATEKVEGIPFASLEGFIRQVLGWRNYVFYMYLRNGQTMKESNALEAKAILKKDALWKPCTGLAPVDNSISAILEHGYVHHIVRLMILGSFFLFIGVHPTEAYRYFMEWTIDSYEWVMVPNVFGMALHADGGRMMTRPYFGSSKYIRRMSNYEKGSWCEIWDDLYYNFIHTHRKRLERNYATARQVVHWKKKERKEKKEIMTRASSFIKRLLS